MRGYQAIPPNLLPALSNSREMQQVPPWGGPTHQVQRCTWSTTSRPRQVDHCYSTSNTAAETTLHSLHCTGISLRHTYQQGLICSAPAKQAAAAAAATAAVHAARVEAYEEHRQLQRSAAHIQGMDPDQATLLHLAGQCLQPVLVSKSWQGATSNQPPPSNAQPQCKDHGSSRSNGCGATCNTHHTILQQRPPSRCVEHTYTKPGSVAVQCCLLPPSSKHILHLL
jgi:hypothetical protein